ncbi:hypothetical protein NKH14_23015 [Mesorhizobium sp. M1380]|uniref:hypothetical protein n=1 Tax=Mesorhizobium sp. M1380 TaxID=2957093 RepID=UPI00333951A2
MSVFINEVEGRLVNRSEATGTKDHLGISYLFDVVERTDPKTGRVWRKQSYNVGALNRSAGLLFSDALFNKAHGSLALGSQLANTKDPVWYGSRYPVEIFAVSQKQSEVGYILEADFYKFRGRGLIQTTWRENYKKIIRFIKSYKGTSEVINEYKEQWSALSDDDACTVSTNSDWDSLFGDSGKAVLCEAIRIHANQGKYLPLASATDELNGTHKGSLVFIGNSIGGNGYGQRLKGRVRQMCLALES